MTSKNKNFKPNDIKQLRKARRMTQAEFGRFVGVSVSAVKKWELALQIPSPPVMKLMELAEKGTI